MVRNTGIILIPLLDSPSALVFAMVTCYTYSIALFRCAQAELWYVHAIRQPSFVQFND